MSVHVISVASKHNQMLRPTRSRVVTELDIWLCPVECNVMKRKSRLAHLMCKICSASCEAAGS
jgi:transcription elongation factor Elf1